MNRTAGRKIRLFVVCCFLTAGFVLGGCTQVPDPETPSYKTKLAADEIRNSAFKKQFPLHYETFLANNDDTQMTEYAGSVPHEKHLCGDLPRAYKYCQPYLKNLWMGYPFSFEYNRARGHTYALYDLLHIDRINRYSEEAGLPSTCYTCKTPKMVEWVEKYDDDFWAMEFHSFREELDLDDHTIGCATCHDPQSMDLRITSVPLDEALKRMGQDWREASRNEMRSLVCAQCHVEYYFQDKALGPEAKPVFPWDLGKNPENVYEYYKDKGSTERKGFEGNFVDWTHAVSDTPMIKIQHPEYETWYDGPHGAAGVSCSDCHMPYRRMDGKKKISSHHWTSPLKSAESIGRTCGQCHADKTPEFLKGRVVYTQERTWEQLLVAQDLSVKAHEAVRLARAFEGAKPDNYEDLIIAAQERIRKGQMFWDWVSAENSAGFHNPAKALETLARSQQYSQEAVNYAMQATGYATAPKLEGNIKDIVAPIKEHSRKLQQSQEHLDSHPWLGYLPLLPEADLVWDLNKRVGPETP
ncbi:nitrite reductase (cytochrome c-552) [Desulfobotulus alkaliphilus]|uniref:nitrite reductase (cytochrome; ammonia-forming) n=1 Tax=Desulfobotulus alkaliphilus TaxID=622671 RepID=A0A562S850_9BACT|nr:ammonia-forming cytochrome c nitrite reductase subunit c552 [Desulfobotulus alkaliphilus]TWI77498.1 nitrite reductase (cytochrome c-552) [Desulfobotulus alkaliphilus]